MTSVRDIIIVAIILFVVGTSIVFITKIGHNINNQLLEVPIFNNTESSREVITSVDAAINSTDYLYLALFIAFFISIIIFGYLVGGTQVMSVIYFFIIILFTFVSIILQLAWMDIASTPQLVTTVAQLPITNYILSHLGYFTALMGIIGLIAMYAKPYIGGDGYYE